MQDLWHATVVLVAVVLFVSWSAGQPKEGLMQFSTPSSHDIKDHETRGGVWLGRRHGGGLAMWLLAVKAGVRVGRDAAGGEWVSLEASRVWSFTPCDQQGRPLPLVERCESMNRARLTDERLHLDALEELVEELVEVRARVKELEALRCDCDEEIGKHEDTCPVMLHEALRGATEYAHDMERERDDLLQERKELRAHAVAQQGRLDALEVELIHITDERDDALDANKKLRARVASLEADLEVCRGCKERLLADRDTALARAVYEKRAATVLAEAKAKDDELLRQRTMELYSVNKLLGAPDTPEGKALRALVKAAKSGLRGTRMDCPTHVFGPALNVAVDEADWEKAAAFMAVLLARKEAENHDE